jgi:hypothetical protein
MKPGEEWGTKLKEIVRDGNLIASRSLDDFPSFCEEIIEALAR